MSAKTLERTAQQRVRRTRTRAVSPLAALAVSTLPPHEYDLEPACISLVCPSCRTWVPVNKPNSRQPKLVPHHTEPAGSENAVRCLLGSNRLVVLDVDVERWWQRLEEGVSETDGRRSNRVTRKPQTAVTPAVSQILAPLVMDTATTLRRCQDHVKGCSTCVKPGSDRCIDGDRLARLYAYKAARSAPRSPALTPREELAELREQNAWRLRELQWASTAASVNRADIQRARDALVAMLQSLSPKRAGGPQLTDWERADLMSAIAMLATKVEQLSR
ncbi:hypothetical protein [Streptomyces sp. NBC_01708]|uniref:hypothetical protein n=1 Tax=Streptomyces sp. NBC_01708 TaxID=2975915 RepID=UPI002E3297A9|nr:hypothetical protein [Streptomyces sp. NBC_01708]